MLTCALKAQVTCALKAQVNDLKVEIFGCNQCIWIWFFTFY